MKRFLNNPKIERLSIIITLCSLTLIKIFPFYLGESNSKLFSTHVIAKLLLIFPFLFILLKRILLHRPDTHGQKLDLFFILSLLFYLGASAASVVVAIDILAYLRQLQNIVVNSMYFYIGYSLFSQKKYQALFFRYLLLIGVFCMMFDSVFLLMGNSFLELIKNNVQIEMAALFAHNARMGRFNSYMVLDSFIPLFFLTYHYSQKKKVHTLLFIISIIVSLFLSYASLFRTRLIQGVFALLASLFIFFKEKRRLIISLLFIPILFFGIYFVSRIISPTSITIVERFLLSDKQEDVNTIQYRFTSLQKAFELLQSSPLIGVGLGNYKAYTNRGPGFGINDKLTKIHYEETLDNPHSIFIEVLSETGFLGFIGYLSMLCYFVYKDARFISFDQDKRLSAIIILAWTIFLYGIFNPFNTVYIAGWFWFMRGYIQIHYV